ncbi:MAG TPA: hypothetical protein VF310_16670 [Vicinamibacteria bacterium]
MNNVLKRSLRALGLAAGALILASQTGTPVTPAAHAYPPPGVDFCAWARDEAAGCWRQYENCGGLEGDGCYDQLEACLQDSGIWECE